MGESDSDVLARPDHERAVRRLRPPLPGQAEGTIETETEARVRAGAIRQQSVENILVKTRPADIASQGDLSNANVISAVGAVQGIYRQHGGRILSDTIATVQAGLGEHSYDRPNLMGISMVLARYGVEPAAMARALLGVRGGTKGLLQSANRIREATGCTRNDSFAAAMVEAYNRAHRGRGRLANWFASDEAAAA